MRISLTLLNPIYWPAWFGLGLLWLITRLPYAIQFKIGSGIGRLLYLLPSKLKEVTLINIKLCFPELSAKEQTTLAKNNFMSLGLGLIEAGMAWWLSSEQLNNLYQLHGVEHVAKAYQKGKGVILVAPHSTCIEMVGRLLGMHYTFGVMYYPHKKPFIAFIHERFRKKHYGTYIPRHHMRQLLRALEQNMAIWYAYDVDGGKKRSLFAPFFNIQTASLTAVRRLVDLSEAVIVPISYYRREGRFFYDVIISPPLETFGTEDPIQDLTQLNQILEKAIRLKPEQYVWQYKRFKTRPPGEKRFY